MTELNNKFLISEDAIASSYSASADAERDYFNAVFEFLGCAEEVLEYCGFKIPQYYVSEYIDCFRDQFFFVKGKKRLANGEIYTVMLAFSEPSVEALKGAIHDHWMDKEHFHNKWELEAFKELKDAFEAELPE